MRYGLKMVADFGDVPAGTVIGSVELTDTVHVSVLPDLLRNGFAEATRVDVDALTIEDDAEAGEPAERVTGDSGEAGAVPSYRGRRRGR